MVLERHGHRAAVPFGSLIYEPGNNIWAWPDDTIYLYKEPQTYLAFGASGQQGQFQFSSGSASSAWRMTLAEAVAAAGGLIDIQADPGSVFLYRREPRQLAEKLGVDCSKMDGPTVPIVYSVSFSDPAGYFLATRVQMHNKDVIFAANAQAVEITKFTTFLNTLLSVPINTTDLGINIETWRILSRTRWRLRAYSRTCILHRSGSSDGVPIVYSLSFSDPAGYFLATRIQMHNKDVIFVANAQAVEITKFTTFLNTLIRVPANVGLLGTTFQNLRILSATNPTSSSTVVSSPVVVSTVTLRRMLRNFGAFRERSLTAAAVRVPPRATPRQCSRGT